MGTRPLGKTGPAKGAGHEGGPYPVGFGSKEHLFLAGPSFLRC